jgi:hypothetical protein
MSQQLNPLWEWSRARRLSGRFAVLGTDIHAVNPRHLAVTTSRLLSHESARISSA